MLYAMMNMHGRKKIKSPSPERISPIDREFGKDNSVTIRFPHKIRDSLQTEYNYKDFNPTELQFMAEYLSSQPL